MTDKVFIKLTKYSMHLKLYTECRRVEQKTIGVHGCEKRTKTNDEMTS